MYVLDDVKYTCECCYMNLQMFQLTHVNTATGQYHLHFFATHKCNVADALTYGNLVIYSYPQALNSNQAHQGCMPQPWY